MIRLAVSGLSVLTVLILILYWQGKAPFLIDNDNIYLKTVASGEMTGTPEPHMYYMEILSGTVLSLLYRLTGNGIPWFGIFLCLCFGVTMALLLDRSLKACRHPAWGVCIYLVYILVFGAFFYQYFAKTQYTIATGIIGAGALFLLAVTEVHENTGIFLKRNIPFLILCAWSFGMREKGFLMLLPFLGMTFLAKVVFLKGEAAAGKKFRNTVFLGVLFVALLGGLHLMSRLAYSDAEWQEFRAYTDASEILFDYDGFPDYDSHEELYREVGITRSSYEAITRHYNILLDPAIGRESMEKLAQTAEAERLASMPPVGEKLAEVAKIIFRRNFLDYVDRPLNVLVYLLYLFVFLLAVLKRRLRALWKLSFIVIARMFDWVYLIWFGRYPFRVTQIIYVAELVLLIALILKEELWKVDNGKEKSGSLWKKFPAHPVFLLLLTGIVFVSFRFGFPKMKAYQREIQGLRTMSVCFPELEGYLEEHPENFYYFDMSHLYYMEDTLPFKPAAFENYVYMGSWMPGSPWYNHKIRNAGIVDIADALITMPNVYLIYQQVDFDTRDFLDAYYADHFPGTKLVVKDVFTSSNGFVYEILKAEE